MNWHKVFKLGGPTGLIRRSTGKPAGYLSGGYYFFFINTTRKKRRRFPNHRVVYEMVHGHPPKFTVDHDNRIKTDNHPDNLKDKTVKDNCQNSRANPRGKRLPY